MNKRSKQKKAKTGLIEYLSVKAELPSDALTGSFRIELRGRNELLVHGCRRILSYSPTNVRLAARDFSVEVEGERLVFATYYDGTVCVDGLVKKICFDDGDEL